MKIKYNSSEGYIETGGPLKNSAQVCTYCTDVLNALSTVKSMTHDKETRVIE